MALNDALNKSTLTLHSSKKIGRLLMPNGNGSTVCIVVLPHLISTQIPYIYPNQYGLTVNGEVFQQQQMHHQQQLPMHQPQQPQQQHQIQQQPQQPQQQHQIQQQPQQPQQQHQIQQQPQQQHQIQQQQLPMHQPQQQHQIHNQQQQQQPQMYPRQPYYQGNMQDPSIQSSESIQPMQPLQPFVNNFQPAENDHLNGQVPALSPIGSSERYLVGNLSESFSFQVAPPSTKVTHLGLNGYSLYIVGIGLSDKSKFQYDEQNNHLTILSLDSTTVGYYSAVDANWQTFVNILSAINVSSLKIHNSHTSEDNNGSSLVSCSVSIIRSTFKLSEPPSSSNNLAIPSPSSLPLSSRTSAVLAGTENLPRLDLFLSSRVQQSALLNNKIYNDTLNEYVFTRTISIQRPLTRVDHNGTVQCQVESNNNNGVFLIKTLPIDVAYGPNLEAGALPAVNLESRTSNSISMECQIEANPTPSYIWYDMLNNNSTGMMPYYGQQNPYGQQYPLQSPLNMPMSGLTVFSTTRQIQRLYQHPGQYAMQCQAQSRGKTIKQDFFITVLPSSDRLKAGTDGNREKSNKTAIIIGLIIGGIFLLVLVGIIIGVIIFLKRRKPDVNENRSLSSKKSTNDKQGKLRWGNNSNLPIDHSKYKHEALKGDSSSTSHLVESAESSTSHAPPIPNRSSPIPSTHSSYRQVPVSLPLAYQEANAFPGSRRPPPTRSYSPDQDDGDEINASINAMPITTNRSRTTTPFGSRKSLSESIQSLRSNQQPALSLPVKKRSQEASTLPSSTIPKRDQQTPSPKLFSTKKDYQHHHYHNPAQLRAQQQAKNSDASSEEDESKHQQQLNNATEDSAFLPKKFTFRVQAGPVPPTKASISNNQKEYQQQHGRRVRTPPPPQQMVVHQPTAVHHDEPPPSYRQAANSASLSTAYVYQEPTEV
ncbi:unnamed protein product [Rotaria socialis]|uniref:Ig-like domain-containing protein n=3 Tax=Rotaria socialis TaxID=392032 RepID=A0A817U4X4_9BILA|nr:unnamed protein product [Rotaria socialis]CAF3425898.1 unnamed protein product [Rotaria socialis]